jgi:prephenate dehydrogenase
VLKEIDRSQVQRLVEGGARLVEVLPEDHDAAIAEAVTVRPALEPLR